MKKRDIISLLNRAIAGLETPNDLTGKDIQELIEDIQELIEDIEEPNQSAISYNI